MRLSQVEFQEPRTSGQTSTNRFVCCTIATVRAHLYVCVCVWACVCTCPDMYLCIRPPWTKPSQHRVDKIAKLGLVDTGHAGVRAWSCGSHEELWCVIDSSHCSLQPRQLHGMRCDIRNSSLNPQIDLSNQTVLLMQRGLRDADLCLRTIYSSRLPALTPPNYII